MQVELKQLSLREMLPQSTCFCLLSYTHRGFVMPQTLDVMTTRRMLQAFLLSKQGK